jgi:hypothetical protein
VKLDEVPQDASPTYAGHKKLLYATTADGEYCTAQSSGWEAEAFATELAVAALEQWPGVAVVIFNVSGQAG